MIRIVTDSAADLTAEQLSVPGIFVVPLSVTFADGTTQLDDCLLYTSPSPRDCS